MSSAGLLGGYAADLVLGDPQRRHPVAGFGWIAERLERRLHRDCRLRGALHTASLVGAAALGAAFLDRLASVVGGRTLLLAALTWSALGGRSLARTAEAVAMGVEAGDLSAARRTLPALVGRDPDELDDAGVCRAVVESVAENTSDAVVGTLLWGSLAGPAGVAAHRAANTLDAMVGHRTPRYERFGWAAARLDDALGWPPARVGAALTVACAPMVGGSPRAAWSALRGDGAAHPSPNAGQMEAAFAGALGVRLGGPISYGGRPAQRPFLGVGPAPSATDIRRAARLSLAVGSAAAVLCAGLRSLIGARR